ncbi:Hypothetical predicted protein [Octopus vulgaris]|uniref:Uncharacterized protein n=1 Tax=Octopus vulgaris TaxID=6645 RepID=A0AA36AWU8_OCTVU|nr:Hypothetical predicted protein [Octopus vulgaris]
MILKNRMRWRGHIVRMVDERTLKQLFYGELAEGKRDRCKPRNRFKDGIRIAMRSLGMDSEEIETLISDRAGRPTKVWSGEEASEQARITQERFKEECCDREVMFFSFSLHLSFPYFKQD